MKYLKAYSELCQTSKMVCFEKTVNGQKSLTVFAQHSLMFDGVLNTRLSNSCIQSTSRTIYTPGKSSILFYFTLYIFKPRKNMDPFIFKIVFCFNNIGAFNVNCRETSFTSVTSGTSQPLLLYKSLDKSFLMDLSKFPKYCKKKIYEDFFHF